MEKDIYNIAVLIPCYNEGQTIKKVVEDFSREFPNSKVYVYDNNSSDGSAEIAAAAGGIVKKERRQGKGNVVRSMFRDIVADCYILVDADDTYSAEDAHKLVNLIRNENVDMAVGDRLSTTYFTENKRPFHNFGNRLVRNLIRKLFKTNINDIMTGYRAFSYNFVKGFPVLSNGFEIETEMTIHAVYNNFNIIEIPVRYRDRPDGSNSKLNTYRDGARVISTIITLFKEYKPTVFFNAICTIFSIVGIILIVPPFDEYYRLGHITMYPRLFVGWFLIVIGLLNMITGIILDVICKKMRQNYELYMNMLKIEHTGNKG